MNPRPNTDSNDSSNDHVKNVSFILKSKYSLNIQNPASLTCEQKTLPAPIARTISEIFTSLDSINGNTMPTDDSAETVEDPSAKRKIAVANQAKIIGDISVPWNNLDIVSPTPPSISTCLNTPPPPMIKSNIAIGVIAFVTVVMI